MEIVLFIYRLVAIVVTGHILLTREKDIDDNDISRLVEWAEDGHMHAAPAAVVSASAADAPAADDDLLPGEDEDHWEDLAEDWEFPEIGND